MVHILIAYCSRHGTTRRAGQLLAESWPEATVTFCDLSIEPMPEVESFDAVVFGASVHGGFIQSEVRRSCDLRHLNLLEKPLGLFMCYMDEVHAADNFERGYPKPLRDHAAARGLFGGSLVFEHMTWLDKLIVTRFTSYRENVDKLRMEELNKFATRMMEAIKLVPVPA